MSSPAHAKMQNIADRLRSSQSSQKQDRDRYRSEIEKSVARIENSLAKISQTDRSQFSSLKEQLTAVQDALATQKAQREIQDDKKTKEIRVVEAAVTVEFNLERQHRKELGERIQQLVDTRNDEIRAVLDEETTNLNKMNNELKESCGAQLNTVLEDLSVEREYKNAEFSRIQNDLKNQSNDLKSAIDVERTERIKLTDDLYNRLIGVVNQLQDSIKKEREDRELCEEGLIQLLEQTCKKVEEGA